MFSPEINLIDVTNDLRRRRRRKRQAPSSPRSRLQDNATPWHGKMAFAISRPTNHHHHHPNPHGPTHPQSVVHKFHVSSFNYQPGKQDDFQPFIPAYQQTSQGQPGQHGSHNPQRVKPVGGLPKKLKNENFAFFNIQYVPKGLTTTTLKYPQYFNAPHVGGKQQSPSPFGLTNLKEPPGGSSSFSHFGTFDVFNKKETEAITKKYRNDLHQGDPHKITPRPQDIKLNSTQVKPEFLSPPKLNLEEVLERIRENQRAKVNQTVVTHYTTSRPLRVGNLNDEYYYYDYEDDDDVDADDDKKVTSAYSSHKNQSTSNHPENSSGEV
ncbi:uncharacterized protein [Atheta coriaria]|uniref:uncharacterized protein n=1 Tax=Dalotia coriaria TaxID=877792 RepID=UPI0031F40D7F